MFYVEWKENGKHREDTMFTLSVGVAELMEQLIEKAASGEQITDIQIQEIED